MIASISGNGLYNPGIQNRFQQVQQDFQQLGQDLQAGNLTAAQSDFTTLTQIDPQFGAASSAASGSPMAQAFGQLSQDLQSGNLSGAQQDFTTIQQDFQNRMGLGHHHHHSTGAAQNNPITQAIDTLGQEMQSGSLPGAQQAYTSLQQALQPSAPASGSSAAENGAAAMIRGVLSLMA